MEYVRFHPGRVRHLAGSEGVKSAIKGVVYYMHRDQRVHDNWAAIYAQEVARKHSVPLHIVAGLNAQTPAPPEATRRAVNFSLEGLRLVYEECKLLSINFHFLQPHNQPMYQRLMNFIRAQNVNCVVADFSPLHPHRKQIAELAKQIDSHGNSILYQVDAHNIVPCWIASNKEEWRAFEMRKCIMSKFNQYFTEFPTITKHPISAATPQQHINWDAIHDSVEVDETVGPVDYFKPGPKHARAQLEIFLRDEMPRYADKRNDPTVDAISDLSPWLHAGHISAQRVIIEVKKLQKEYPRSVEKYVDEAVTWSEMSDNYCLYNDNYDNIEGAPDWAKTTLMKHKSDERQWIYTREQWANAETHDALWNAAQMQLVKTGKMHGYMRMYWAKKILEWSATPELAIADAIYLNDKFSLDGADSNGFNGVMWSIAGVHDPPKWGERPIFGTIRYQSYNGCKSKFDVQKYIGRWYPEGAALNKNARIDSYFKSAESVRSADIDGSSPARPRPSKGGRKGSRVQGSWGGPQAR